MPGRCCSMGPDSCPSRRWTARNAPKPTAATASAPPMTNRPARDAGRRAGARARRPRRRRPPTGRSGGGSAAGFDGERMGRREDQPDLLARLPQLGAGRALDVLLVDGHRAAAARLDDVARRDAEVRGVADGAEQLVDAIGDGIGQLEQPDLLRADADLVAGQALGQGSRDPDRGPVRELGDGEVTVGALRRCRQAGC